MIWFLLIWQFLCMAIYFAHNRYAPWAALFTGLIFAGVLVPWAFGAAFIETWRDFRRTR